MGFSEVIEQQISDGFPPALTDQVRRVLRPDQSDRVLQAVLKLSDGDLARLQHFSDAAAIDERDVLLWVETSPQPGEATSYEELRERLHLPEG